MLESQKPFKKLPHVKGLLHVKGLSLRRRFTDHDKNDKIWCRTMWSAGWQRYGTCTFLFFGADAERNILWKNCLRLWSRMAPLPVD